MLLGERQSFFEVSYGPLQFILTHSFENHWVDSLRERLRTDERVVSLADVLDDFYRNQVVDRAVSFNQELIVIGAVEGVVRVAKDVNLNHVSIQKHELVLVIDSDFVKLKLDLVGHHARLEITQSDVKIYLKFVDIFARECYALNDAAIVDSKEHCASIGVQVSANVACHCFQVQNGEVFKFDVDVFINVNFAIQHKFGRFECIRLAQITSDFYHLLFGVRVQFVNSRLSLSW